jgi:hypothetical protein
METKDFVEKVLEIKLTPYQKDILKTMDKIKKCSEYLKEHGKPLCPNCDREMVQVTKYQWQCGCYPDMILCVGGGGVP